MLQLDCGEVVLHYEQTGGGPHIVWLSGGGAARDGGRPERTLPPLRGDGATSIFGHMHGIPNPFIRGLVEGHL